MNSQTTVVKETH